MFTIAMTSCNEQYDFQTYATRLQAETQLDKILTRHSAWLDRYELCVRPSTNLEIQNAFNNIRPAMVWNGHLDRLTHAAHIDDDDPSKITYVDTQDKLVSMKPGRYLKRFYDELTDKQIIFYAEWWQRGTKPALDIGELKFAKTEDEFVHVYANGPHSCMAEDDSVAVYAAGDLQLAYLQDDEQIIARALCWPDRKAFGRVYPNDDDEQYDDPTGYREELFSRLKALGWTQIYEDRSVLDGARVIKRRDEVGDYIMPYLDGVRLTETDEYFVLAHNGEIGSGNTDGRLDHDRQSILCGQCGSPSLAENTQSTFEEWSTYNNVPLYHRHMCNECLPRHAFFCEGSQVYYRSRFTASIERNGHTYEHNWLNHHRTEVAA